MIPSPLPTDDAQDVSPLPRHDIVKFPSLGDSDSQNSVASALDVDKNHHIFVPTARPAATKPSLSIIIPAYNEESRLRDSLMRLDSYLSMLDRTAEVIVVENGSTDRTAVVAEECRQYIPYLRLLRMSTAGKGWAVRSGMLAARGDYLMFCDIDFSMPAASIDLFLAELDAGAPIVIASRELAASRRHDEPQRRYVLGRVFNRAVQALVVGGFTDTQCGFKAFQREVAHDLFARQQTRGWAFDVEILHLARRRDYRVRQIAIDWYYDHDSRVRGLHDSLSMAMELVRMRARPLLDPSRRVSPALPSGGNLKEALTTPAAPAAPTETRPGFAKLRILALNWRCTRHPQAGGAETNIFEQARWWVANGHDVTIVCADPGRAHAPSCHETIDGINVRRMGGRLTVYPLAALYMLRHAHRFDRVLDIANGIPFFTPLITRTPTVLMVHHVHHQQWFAEFPRPLASMGWFVERCIVPRIYQRHAVIAVSPTTRDALVGTGFDPARVAIVYSGVADIGDAARHAINRPTLDTDTPRIAYVGRIKAYKRVELLVRAVSVLRAEFPALHLDIVGTGDAQPSIESLIDQLGLQASVTLHGFVDEKTKGEILRRATAFATPSMHEGWGLSVIEANTFGCPAVAYDVPGLRNAIRHGETGLLASDDLGFQQAIAAILRDPDLRGRLAGGAREWSSQFGWGKCADTTLQVLRARRVPPTPTVARAGFGV